MNPPRRRLARSDRGWYPAGVAQHLVLEPVGALFDHVQGWPGRRVLTTEPVALGVVVEAEAEAAVVERPVGPPEVSA